MPAESANPIAGFFPMIIIFLIFWFLVIKPQRDKQKELKKTVENLKKNDQVVTIGGAHGTVVLVKEKTVVVRVDDNAKIEFDKESIASAIKTKE